MFEKHLWKGDDILSCYAAFKVRKRESLFHKINAFLQKTTTCIGLQAEQILSKYIIYIFFNFGRGICGSVPLLFPKVPASCCKKILN